MDIEARKYQLIEQVMKLSEEELKKMEAFLEDLYLDPQLKEKLTKRALQSEKDIKEGRVYTLEEAEARLNKRLGL
jgi:hypothetical protein